MILRKGASAVRLGPTVHKAVVHPVIDKAMLAGLVLAVA